MRAAVLCAGVLCASGAAADLNFIAVGDWGHDNSGEYACAAGMGKVAEDIGAEFSVMLGDNFYGSGLHLPDDGPDGLYRMNKTFESVYNASSLQNIPFYAIAGNHDHGGNVTAQIAYSKDFKTRWTYPDWYYGVKKEFNVQIQNRTEKRSLEILLFDSVIGLGNSDKLLANGTIVQLKGSELPGPDPKYGSLADDQWKWLNASIQASTADYLWVGAHYPVWSVGTHGPSSGLQRLRPLLQQFGAQYFCGHDHISNFVADGSVSHIVTGAGMSCCYGDSHLGAVRAALGNDSVRFAMTGGGGSSYQQMPFPMKSGFTSYRAGAESMAVHFHAHDGTELFVTPPIPRRTGKGPLPPIPPAPPTPAPAPPTPVPPVTPVPMPAGKRWACEEQESGSIGTDKDVGNVGAGMVDCETRCLSTAGCVAIVWHISDTHCHLLSGTFSHDDFLAALTSNKDHTACMLVDA